VKWKKIREEERKLSTLKTNKTTITLQIRQHTNNKNNNNKPGTAAK